jgi:hypothetical protein
MKKVIYGFGLLVFLVICCNQEVLAAPNVTLNVNAEKSGNKIYDAAGVIVDTLPWKEKVVYGDYGEVAITVSNELQGDLIIKVDYLEASNPAGNMNVTSAWLKYGNTGYPPFSSVEPVMNGRTAFGSTDVVSKAFLPSLCLVKQLPKKMTLTLFNYFTKSSMPAHIIFTAILVDDVTAATPQVMGVDVQTVFFNYIDLAAVPAQTPIWLKLIQSD